MTFENAQIKRTTLGVEDHGILTSYIHVSFGGSGQGYGGYNLMVGATCAAWIQGILQAVGVDDWSKLPGQYVRVESDKGMLVAIGHIVEDRWYSHADTIDRLTP